MSEAICLLSDLDIPRKNRMLMTCSSVMFEYLLKKVISSKVNISSSVAIMFAIEVKTEQKGLSISSFAIAEKNSVNISASLLIFSAI